MEFTPEPISAIVAAVAAALAALGIPALRQGIASAKKASPEDHLKESLDANTKAQQSMLDQFKHNNNLFVSLGAKLDQANTHLKDIEHIQQRIHTELVRNSRK